MFALLPVSWCASFVRLWVGPPLAITVSPVKAQQLFEALTRDELEVLRLCCVEDLSYDEAAQRLGLSRKALMQRLCSARLRVAEIWTAISADN